MTREEIFEQTINKYLEPVRDYMEKPGVNEIMINGPGEVYIEEAGRITAAPEVHFGDPERLMAIARNLAQYTNQRITSTTARFDSRLPDKSRVHVVLPRCSRNGLCISIRRFSLKDYTLDWFVEKGSLTPEAKDYLEFIVASLEMNMIIAGGTGTGKTSFLNALSGHIPPDERIIVIEDTAELQLQQPHVLRFEAAAADRKGEGAVTIRHLFHSALRMRPDRIVIGECRAGEALDLIQAMTSGHGGSMSTLHASTPLDALHRLETMALMSDVKIPLGPLRVQVASAINLVVQLTRLSSGSHSGARVVSAIAEVDGVSRTDEDYVVNTVFERLNGSLRWTGHRSRFVEEMVRRGMTSPVSLANTIFAVADAARR